MDRLSIQFELRPLADIEPWGGPDRPSLSWFGLTDGDYDLVVNDHHLFSAPDDPRGVDYQIVRLWEDLMDVVPAALAPLPDELAARAARGDAWIAWCDAACDAREPGDELTRRALGWWARRHLSAMHLVNAPSLALWRRGDDLHLHWRSRPPAPGAFVWSSPRGDATISVSAFRDTVLAFDRAFIAAMHVRTAEVAAGGLAATIAVDVPALLREQADRSTWFAAALARFAAPTWDDTVAALVELEARRGSSVLGSRAD